MDSQVAESRTFYSKAAALQVSVGRASKRVDENGMVVYTPTKLAAFTPQSDNYGRYETDDPEVIAVLQRHPDVISHQQYVDAILPPAEKVRQVLEENKRLITEKNRLMAQLQTEGKFPLKK